MKYVNSIDILKDKCIYAFSSELQRIFFFFTKTMCVCFMYMCVFIWKIYKTVTIFGVDLCSYQ